MHGYSFGGKSSNQSGLSFGEPARRNLNGNEAGAEADWGLTDAILPGDRRRPQFAETRRALRQPGYSGGAGHPVLAWRRLRPLYLNSSLLRDLRESFSPMRGAFGPRGSSEHIRSSAFSGAVH